MFTGIIQAEAKIIDNNTSGDIVTLKIARPDGWKLSVGQSISINGVCLTVVDYDEAEFSVQMMPETLDKTSFGSKIPAKVNLERAMSPSSLLEGHIVQGHVDVTATLKTAKKEANSAVLTFSFPSKFDSLVVDKGSVTIDGISLTVVNPSLGELSVALIPHTLENTTLGEAQEGDRVNIEFDIIGKYVAKKIGDK